MKKIILLLIITLIVSLASHLYYKTILSERLLYPISDMIEIQMPGGNYDLFYESKDYDIYHDQFLSTLSVKVQDANGEAIEIKPFMMNNNYSIDGADGIPVISISNLKPGVYNITSNIMEITNDQQGKFAFMRKTLAWRLLTVIPWVIYVFYLSGIYFIKKNYGKYN